MRNIIVVGANPKLVVQVMLSAHSHSHTRSFVVGEGICRPVRRSTLCAGYEEVSLQGTQDDLFIYAIKSLSKENPDFVLIPADCAGIAILNRTAQHLTIKTIPYPALATMEMLNDKWTFYQFCVANGFRTPKTLYVGGKLDLDFDLIEVELGLPFVLKPVNQAGGEGVHIVYNKRYYKEHILNDETYRFSPLIAQRFIPGADGGLSVLSIQGELHALAIQKYVRDGIKFVPNAYLENVAADVCRACDYHGVMNLDVRMEEGTGNTYFTEANPRFWATTFASVWAGLNFVAESIDTTCSPSCIRKLTSGSFHHRRHPIVRPEAWPYLLADKGERGRMARAMTFDLYMLPQFLGSLPGRTVNYAKRHFRKGPETRPNETPPVV